MTGKEIAATHIGHDRGLFGHFLWFGECACFYLSSDTVTE